MKYEKPEIVVIANAISTIQSMAKLAGQLDNVGEERSISAYESDE